MTPKKEWDGIERRQYERDDHDAIIALTVKIEELYKYYTRLELRQDEYEKENNANIGWLKGTAYTGIGIILAIQFLVIFLKR